jgi:hypothetical protein
MSQAIIPFDIETAPEIGKVRELYSFDQSSVKCGNLKDPVKIRAKVIAAEAEFWEGKEDKAALNALTARVIALGYQEPGGEIKILHEGDEFGNNEHDILNHFWRLFQDVAVGHKPRAQFIGWNIFGFDLIMMIQRSRILDIKLPKGLMENRRYWNPLFVDLMKEWGCNQYGQMAGLKKVAKAMGLARGHSDVQGKDFHKFLISDPEKAKAYLTHDVRETREIGERILN